MRIRIRWNRDFWKSRVGLSIAGAVLVVFLVGLGIFLHYWFTYEHMMDERLSGHVFNQASEVFSAPAKIEVGQSMSEPQLVAYLQRAGYTQQAADYSPGWYQVSGSSVEIHPLKDSYFEGTNALRVDFSGGTISAIVPLDAGQSVNMAEIEPTLVTTLFGSSRVKRQVVPYSELPSTLIHAVLAAEDKGFFHEPAFSVRRIIAAAIVDLREWRKAQGASTITMQVARSFFFSRAKTFRRKIKQTLMAVVLSQHFTKQQIFDLYANQVYLGNRGSFAIHGFGEAAQSYFGKSIDDLNLAQDAFLAGIIRAPNYYSSSDHHPNRAYDARNRVLDSMVRDHFITPEQEQAAYKLPLKVLPAAVSSSEAPYFVDAVRQQLLNHFTDTELTRRSYRVYTTLDPQLQEAAVQAVAEGMKMVDQKLAWRYALWRKEGKKVERPQVALVVIDPRTGAVRALVGGRNYAKSQLDHAFSQEPTGSAFKPFVYATAFLSAIRGRNPVITPVSTVIDEPTTFMFDGKTYTPDDYEQRFCGIVTAKQALTYSLNVATVKFARMAGYDNILRVARRMTRDNQIQATPAMALGSYDMSPIQLAAGYTAFDNSGIRAEPMFVRYVVQKNGKVVEENRPKTTPVLDPRVAFLVTSLMESVVNHGTGIVVRQMGFDAPAAAKTGTARDGWFAGFTTKLECVVWVGFNDYRDLGLAGAESAEPIWALFMKKALKIPGYDNPQPFTPPSGVIEASIDPATDQLATAKCPDPEEDYFITGTQPSGYSSFGGSMAAHLSAPVSWMGRLFGANSKPAPPYTKHPAHGRVSAPVMPAPPQAAPARRVVQAQASQPAKQRKKKGFFQRLFGFFGGKKKSSDHHPPHR